jgi:two-component system, chemotaxis family, chemotaxis protein CheY
LPLNLKKISILVVEDLQPMRSLIVSVLDAFGVGTIYEAPHGERGFEYFQKYNPDLVVTDWLMEPVDGLELVNMIRNHKESVNRLVPIIVMTGYSAAQRVIAARDLGATEFLTKPFMGRDLAKRINLIINRPRDFIETDNFFGPSRRRKINNNYSGPRRRGDEGGARTESKNSKSNPWEIVIE